MLTLRIIDSFFFILTFLIFFASFLIITKKNLVHCLLLLIASFFCGVIMLLINNAEFLAFVMLTVYVGAVAVLFLFVIMMIDPEKVAPVKLSKGPVVFSLIIGLFLFYLFSGIVTEEVESKSAQFESAIASNLKMLEAPEIESQSYQFGRLLYDSEYAFAIAIASLILFVAAISVIVLTLRYKTDLKKQSLFRQLLRHKKDTLELKKVGYWEGVNDE